MILNKNNSGFKYLNATVLFFTLILTCFLSMQPIVAEAAKLGGYGAVASGAAWAGGYQYLIKQTFL